MAIQDEHIDQPQVAESEPGLRERLWPLPRQLPLGVLVVGLALGLSSLVTYDSSGYGHGMLLLWLAGLLTLAIYFWSRSTAIPRIATRDLVAPGALMLALSPLYLAHLYRWPVQVSSDEVAIMQVSRQYAHEPHVDPFGLSTYLGRPVLLFLGWGRLGELFGGIDLFQMRLVHALFGVALIGLGYMFFRQLLPRGWAIVATFLLGASHSLFMISRLAMRENTAVIIEVVALTLLLWGLRHDHPLATFSGGFVAGLGFYVYFPARATFPLWVLFLAGLALFYRTSFPLRKLLHLGSIAAAGFVLMAGPIMIAEANAPATTTPDSRPQRESLLLFPEARALQQQWVFASSEAAGIRKNIHYGLTTFNNEVPDHGWIYENHGHGFVDPLTGILLWAGVVLVGLRLFRRREDPAALLPLGGFIALWLAFAFLVNKAPNYTRLLITLPFVVYLVTEAIRAGAGNVGLWTRRWGPARASQAAALFVVGTGTALAVWNFSIAWDFIQDGRRSGEAIGSTARYVKAHRDIPGQTFYISGAENGTLEYYNWGWPTAWRERLRMFARDGQVGEPIPATELSKFRARPPFALFMRRELWSVAQTDLTARYPRGRLRNITPDGTRVVLEVPRSA